MVTATAEAVARCDYCASSLVLSQLFEPYRGAWRCRDTEACSRRQLRAYDPTIPPDEDLPQPPAATAAAGAACAVCGASSLAAALYDRGHGQWFCRDRAACEFRTATDMTPVREDFTDWVITSAEMRHTVAAGGVTVPESRPAPDPADIAARAWSDTMGRKAVTPQGGDLASQMGLRR